MPPQVSDAVLSCDLRRTAVHEAGHAVVAEALTGAPATITIERRQRGPDTWYLGRCVHVQGATHQERALIALAGAVAEVLDGPLARSAPAVLGEAIEARLSVTDRNNAGTFDWRDLDAAIRVVWRLWPSVDARARREFAQFEQLHRRGGAVQPQATTRSNAC